MKCLENRKMPSLLQCLCMYTLTIRVCMSHIIIVLFWSFPMIASECMSSWSYWITPCTLWSNSSNTTRLGFANVLFFLRFLFSAPHTHTAKEKTDRHAHHKCEVRKFGSGAKHILVAKELISQCIYVEQMSLESGVLIGWWLRFSVWSFSYLESCSYLRIWCKAADRKNPNN